MQKLCKCCQFPYSASYRYVHQAICAEKSSVSKLSHHFKETIEFSQQQPCAIEIQFPQGYKDKNNFEVVQCFYRKKDGGREELFLAKMIYDAYTDGVQDNKNIFRASLDRLSSVHVFRATLLRSFSVVSYTQTSSLHHSFLEKPCHLQKFGKYRQSWKVTGHQPKREDIITKLFGRQREHTCCVVKRSLFQLVWFPSKHNKN